MRSTSVFSFSLSQTSTTAFTVSTVRQFSTKAARLTVVKGKSRLIRTICAEWKASLTSVSVTRVVRLR